LAFLLLSGCLHPVTHDVDAIICDMAARPLDVHPPLPPQPLEQLPTPHPVGGKGQLESESGKLLPDAKAADADIVQTHALNTLRK